MSEILCKSERACYRFGGFPNLEAQNGPGGTLPYGKIPVRLRFIVAFRKNRLAEPKALVHSRPPTWGNSRWKTSRLPLPARIATGAAAASYTPSAVAHNRSTRLYPLPMARSEVASVYLLEVLQPGAVLGDAEQIFLIVAQEGFHLPEETRFEVDVEPILQRKEIGSEALHLLNLEFFERPQDQATRRGQELDAPSSGRSPIRVIREQGSRLGHAGAAVNGPRVPVEAAAGIARVLAGPTTEEECRVDDVRRVAKE